MRNLLIFSVIVLTVYFLLISCSHEPGHILPDQEPTGTTSACVDGASAEWTNQPEREGKITVTWFRSSADSSEILTEVSSIHPLIGIYRAPLNIISNEVIRRIGGDSLITFCCGEDKVSKGIVVSNGNNTEFSFDGDSSSESISFGSVNLINVGTWVGLHCQPTSNDHNNKRANIPVSVLSTCKKSNGDEYELETSFSYGTYSTCNTLDN